ncbi:MAG: class I SAM-dependent methyltransferase [Nocardioidaceae bacterium]
MKAAEWDTRYAEQPGMWGEEPNATVASLLAGSAPGTAVDLACGDGRNAAWLARNRWTVTGVDFSGVAIHAAHARPSAPGTVDWVVADVAAWSPSAAVDLVLVAYLHLPPPSLGDLLARAAGWLRPGGRLVYLGHARENLTHGVGGPPDPAVLPTVGLLAEALDGSCVSRLEHVDRPTDAGHAIDVLAVVTPWGAETRPRPS